MSADENSYDERSYDGSVDESSPEESRSDDRTIPNLLGRRHWYNKSKTEIDRNLFQTVDGSKIFSTSLWHHYGRHLNEPAMYAMSKAERALVSEQDEHSVALERTFTRSTRLTQVPYHPDLLPRYDYFAEGLQQNHNLHTLKVSNFNLPPSPWLENAILPTLKANSNRKDLEGDNLTSLELSNCSLSADDLSALASFLVKNKTLQDLNIARNNIDSVSTAKELARAVRLNPMLRKGSVNLAYCSLGGGDHDVLEKILAACKSCESLAIGYQDFDGGAVAMIARFLVAKKKMALTSFSFVAAPIDKENKKLLSKSLVENKSIVNLSLRSNGLQLPAFVRNTKAITKSLERLTHLDLSFNSMQIQGARVMAKYLESNESLISLIISKNNLTTKGANALLPALKENTTLQHLDLSRNWLSDAVSPVIVDMLKNNSTLLTLDLSGNKSVTVSTGGFKWNGGNHYRTPVVPGAKTNIVKKALLDTTSFGAISASNHTCAVTLTESNNPKNVNHQETIRKINALDVGVGRKIRLKIVLALNTMKEKLYKPGTFDDIPLELMPYVLEMVQQHLGYQSFGHEVVPKSDIFQNYPIRQSWWRRDRRLHHLYEIIKSWQCLPLLFARGAGKLQPKKQTKARRQRRKFGDEEDPDDDAYIPKGGRKRGRWTKDPDTESWHYSPPPVY